MRKEQLLGTVKDLAAHLRITEWIVVGSQAIHGQHPDPPASAVVTSADADFTPADPDRYQDWMKYNIAEHFGMDSDYQVEHGYYIEVVNPELPRLPTGWRERALHETTGPVKIDGSQRAVQVTFPEIHDLVAAKAVVRRPQDFEFLQNVVDCGFVEETTLLERIASTPTRKPEHEEDKQKAADAVKAAFINKAPKPPKLTTFRALCEGAGIERADYEHVDGIDAFVNMVSKGGHQKHVIPITETARYFVDTTLLEGGTVETKAMASLETLASAPLEAEQAKQVLSNYHARKASRER